MAAGLAEHGAVGARDFRETIAPRYAPAVMRGLAAHWPLVRAARGGAEALAAHLAERDSGTMVETFTGPPGISGRFHYSADMRGFNFERRERTISQLLDLILGAAGQVGAPSLYMGAAPMDQVAPRAAAENTLDLPPEGTPPLIWIGNPITVSAHYDLSDNIAVVAAGRRRFTLFPPDQTPNLYVGPLDHTVAGQPISMVDFDDPDFERFPRFRDALETAVTVDLDPGDAIFIPALWWHHVRSLEPVNVLVNYWWDPAPAGTGTAFEAMVHAMLGLRELPPERRAAFKAMFEHYAFGENGDPAAHLPPEGRGILGEPDAAQRRRIRTYLANALVRQLKQ